MRYIWLRGPTPSWGDDMIRAFVFDLDGTLVETEELKALSYARAAGELRPALNEGEMIEAFKDLVGLSRHEVAVGLMRRFGLEGAARDRMVGFGVNTPWQAYVQMRLRIYETLLADPNIVLSHRYSHNIALLCEVRREGYPTALATQSHREQAKRVLDILGLADEFDVRPSMATFCDLWNKANPQEVYSHRSAVRRTYRLAVEALVPPYLPLGLDW